MKVYRALRELLCDRCGQQIKEAELFTRWPLVNQTMHLLPRCRKCLPFELEEPKKGSALISKLIEPTPQAEVKEGHWNQQENQDAVENRLGPVLRWIRRSKR